MSVTPTPRTAEAEKSYWATGFATVVFDRMAELERDLARVTAERDHETNRADLAQKESSVLIAAGATLRTELAKVTAERDASRILHNQDRENYQCATRAGMAVEEQLRARVAELEKERDGVKELMRHRLAGHDLMTIQRNEARDERDGLQQRVAELEQKLEETHAQANQMGSRFEFQQRANAELVMALDDLLECPTVTDRATCPNGDPSRIDEAPEWQAVLQISCAWTRYKKLKALTRAESAAPAKHPDTERLAEKLADSVCSFVKHPIGGATWKQVVVEAQHAIDAARKQEAAR